MPGHRPGAVGWSAAGMGLLNSMNVWLAGFFACAAIHYTVHWWLSRHERVFLVFSVQCALYAVFCPAINAFFRARTIPDSQAALDRFVSLGVIIHIVMLQLYANLGGRHDRSFRAVVSGVLGFLAIWNFWVPLRGTVLELRTMPLPWGGTGPLPIRTPPGAPLAILYLSVLAIQVYGFVVARGIWKRDRAGAILVAIGGTAIMAGAIIAILVDFARVRAPYAGASPHVINVLCLVFFVSREYAARGARVAATMTELRAHRERLEELVATRTRELRVAKDEAERASQAKSRFLAHMSHEIRSPLHVMMLNAVILETDGSLSAEQLRCVETLQKSGQHLATLINNVLEMSTIEAGRLTLGEDPFDVGATLGEVAQMFAPQAASHGTELSIEATPGLPRSLLGDGGKVKQILINLVSNAIKFTRAGTIHVMATWNAVAETGALVEIVVADTGIGIGEQDLARMFQPFERLDGDARAGGTGLGLAISLAYARCMGGDISVESAPGSGSRFKLTFMTKRGDPERARESSGPPISLASTAPTRSKVLVVDDVDVIRDIIGVLLGRNGFETRTAADGPAALSIHSEWRPDVVLMDLRMPGMDGFEVIRRLRAAGSTAAIGALTAGAFGDDEREARRAGADFFIRKPFSDRELLDGLARVFATRGAADQGRADVRLD
jgi:signal transduction histidine kinase/CheY-like chemotaxis protein